MGVQGLLGALLTAALITAACGLSWIRRNITVVRVLGSSMSPAYADGETVLARRVRASRLRSGDVAVLRTETGPRAVTGSEVTYLPVIKRVAALPGEAVPADFQGRTAHTAGITGTVPTGRVLVLGDNPERSVDSRDYGLLPLDAVEGRVVRRFREPGRAGSS
ncbi:S26 family signal peptidase [Streptomyces californicus]|uniref:S26 family signal peptidase n=1 Tax=Streptomyces californicus TaxID=67351 RepID=UPI00296FE1CC|nr:S26 family signal peptidase [Streptomyces californicus]MDW4903363.1 S26 family signal peptidase [Streptomyces californicus]